MKLIAKIVLITSLSVATNSSYAGQVIKAFIDEQDGHFLIDLIMQVNAPKQRILEVLTDYNHLEQLSETIISSEILEKKGATTKIKLINEGCIAFFCQTITQVQTVRLLGNNYISIDVEPLANNIKYSVQFWNFKAINTASTRIHYSADIQPDFWVPPLIGTWLFQSRLLEEATLIINNAEKLATQNNSASSYTH